MKHYLLIAFIAAHKWFSLDGAPKEQPAPEPVRTVCQCGCGREECNCQSAGCEQKLPIRWEEKALKDIVMADPPETLILYSPTWCAACKVYAAKVGDGDGQTRIEVRETEAHFTPRSYPVLYSERLGKQLSNPPTDMREIRKAFGIEDKAVANYSGVNAGEIDRALVDAAMQLFRPRDASLQFGNDEIRYAGPVTFIVPKNIGAKSQTVGEVTTLRFTPKPRIRWGVIDQQIDGLKYDGKKVSIELPWMPDLDLDVK